MFSRELEKVDNLQKFSFVDYSRYTVLFTVNVMHMFYNERHMNAGTAGNTAIRAVFVKMLSLVKSNSIGRWNLNTTI